MSDDGFPVEHVRIVVDGVCTVEHLTERMTLAKAALGGTASGAWFGLLIGLLLGLSASGLAAWVWIPLVSVALGAVLGALFGALAAAAFAAGFQSTRWIPLCSQPSSHEPR